MLSHQTITTVKATAAILAKEAQSITGLFYQKLFAEHPELQHIFNMANQAKGEQKRALADSVIAYATHIDKLAALEPAVARIANKHASLQVAPEHYPIVGQFLLQAIAEHLALSMQDPVIVAWGEAYQALAAIFVSAEENIYHNNQQKVGGWRGFRQFKIVEIVEEAVGVKSFYLAPSDGAPVAKWLAGQYVGLKVNPPNSNYTEIRQYSLSNAPNDKIYRVTVKAEQQTQPAGVVSQYLHNLNVGDQLALQPPTGDFVVNEQSEHLVLLAGGVGITPVLSMLLHRINQQRSVENITLILCCRNAEHHIMAATLKALQQKHGFTYFVSYEHGAGADHNGYLDKAVLQQWITNLTSDVYFCGPKPFMSAINNILKQIGFSPEQLHYETFGPKLNLD